MRKFCPNCGNSLTEESQTACPKCGVSFPAESVPVSAQPAAPANGQMPPQNPPAVPTPPPQIFKQITIDRQELFARAIPFFASRSYAVQAQTDYLISFESQNRDVNWIIFIIGCCCGIIWAIIYYYWFTHKHQVTISISGGTAVQVTAIGNTDQAKIDASEFMASIR